MSPLHRKEIAVALSCPASTCLYFYESGVNQFLKVAPHRSSGNPVLFGGGLGECKIASPPGLHRHAKVDRPCAHQQQKSPQEKTVVSITVDPESPESFMKLPKRRRWVKEKYTRWVKTQPCACCGMPADDPHHLIGHGQGGMGTKAHDLFVLPLCRKHHNELHTDTVAFEDKYGSQLELIFRFIDRALAIGVLA